MLSRAAIPWGAVRPLVAVALLLACSAPAAAGCGDYVHVRGKSEATAPGPHHPPADTPCARGECDRPADSAPTTPPAPTGPSVADAALFAGVTTTPPGHRPGWGDPSAVPASAPASVFHPPRS